MHAVTDPAAWDWDRMVAQARAAASLPDDVREYLARLRAAESAPIGNRAERRAQAKAAKRAARKN